MRVQKDLTVSVPCIAFKQQSSLASDNIQLCCIFNEIINLRAATKVCSNVFRYCTSMCRSVGSEKECPYEICFFAHSEFDFREAAHLPGRRFRSAANRRPVGRELRQHESAPQQRESAPQQHESAWQQNDLRAYTQQVSRYSTAKLALLTGQPHFSCSLEYLK